MHKHTVTSQLWNYKPTPKTHPPSIFKYNFNFDYIPQATPSSAKNPHPKNVQTHEKARTGSFCLKNDKGNNQNGDMKNARKFQNVKCLRVYVGGGGEEGLREICETRDWISKGRGWNGKQRNKHDSFVEKWGLKKWICEWREIRNAFVEGRGASWEKIHLPGSRLTLCKFHSPLYTPPFVNFFATGNSTPDPLTQECTLEVTQRGMPVATVDEVNWIPWRRFQLQTLFGAWLIPVETRGGGRNPLSGINYA